MEQYQKLKKKNINSKLNFLCYAPIVLLPD